MSIRSLFGNKHRETARCCDSLCFRTKPVVVPVSLGRPPPSTLLEELDVCMHQASGSAIAFFAAGSGRGCWFCAMLYIHSQYVNAADIFGGSSHIFHTVFHSAVVFCHIRKSLYPLGRRWLVSYNSPIRLSIFANGFFITVCGGKWTTPDTPSPPRSRPSKQRSPHTHNAISSPAATRPRHAHRSASSHAHEPRRHPPQHTSASKRTSSRGRSSLSISTHSRRRRVQHTHTRARWTSCRTPRPPMPWARAASA